VDYPSAIQRPGPAGKVWPDRNAQVGVILHSMEGSLAGAYTVLDDVSLTPTGAYAAASWHFSVCKDGTVYQHYPIEASPFHAGNHDANRKLIGIEHEGGPPGNLGEELTEVQFQASYALCVWLGQQGGFEPSHDRPGLPRTLFEHNEWTQTACPNGRIPWYRYVPVAPPQEDEDSMADRQEVEGSQDIDILNKVATAALGRLVAGDESQGDEMFIRRGPSIDLPADEGEMIIRTKLVNIPAVTGSA
jgi:hypothetical protein